MIEACPDPVEIAVVETVVVETGSTVAVELALARGRAGPSSSGVTRWGAEAQVRVGSLGVCPVGTGYAGGAYKGEGGREPRYQKER